jgi:hypothetical protein
MVGVTLKGPPAEVHVAKTYTVIPLNIDLGGLFGDMDAPCTGATSTSQAGK